MESVLIEENKPSVPLPYKHFKKLNGKSEDELEGEGNEENENEEFSDSLSDTSDSSDSEVEYEKVLFLLENVSLEDQKVKKMERRQRKDSKRLERSQRPSNQRIESQYLEQREQKSPPVDAQRDVINNQKLLESEEKVGGKELIEYTRQQNELKYGKLIKIVELEEKKPPMKKTISLVNPIKFLQTQILDEKLSQQPSVNIETKNEKIRPELVEYTEKQNRAKYKSMIPIKSNHYGVASITNINITGYDRRYEPTKYYVYNLEVTRNDQKSTIFRRYSQFYLLNAVLIKEFPNISHPPFPPKILFGRSHIHQVSKLRMVKLNEYLQEIVKLKDTFSTSETFQDFFRMTVTDAENNTFNKKLEEKGIRFD